MIIGDGTWIGGLGREVARWVARNGLVLLAEIDIAGKLHDAVFERDILHAGRADHQGKLGGIIDAHAVEIVLLIPSLSGHFLARLLAAKVRSALVETLLRGILTLPSFVRRQPVLAFGT